MATITKLIAEMDLDRNRLEEIALEVKVTADIEGVGSRIFSSRVPFKSDDVRTTLDLCLFEAGQRIKGAVHDLEKQAADGQLSGYDGGQPTETGEVT